MSVPAVATGPPKPRPYRRYLTSVLHSRFVHAAALAFGNGIVIAFLGGKGYFWSWFPVGPAGVKALLFSMSSLFIFILQLATLTVGRQTNISTISFLKTIFVQFSAYQALLWYIISGYWFCEVYIWSVPADKELGWVIRGDLSSPDRLNERPIYLKFFFISLAVVQSGIHMYYNESSLHIPIAKSASPQSTNSRTHPIDSVQVQLQHALPRIGRHALISSGITTLVAPFVYKAFFRDFFWQLHLAFAKPFFDLSRSDANPPNTYFIGTILGGAFLVGALLAFTWEFAAFSFLAYICQEPIKDGLPLSAVSKDPNGTLLTGLSTKRDVVKTFAFWELAIIAQRFPDRRKAIFADFERIEGPMWSSMHRCALAVISSIDDRILELQPAPSPPPPVKPEITSLPQITRNPQNQNIFAALPPPTTRTQKVENFLALTNVRALGQSKDAWHPPIDRTKQQLVDFARSEVENNKALVSQYTTSITSGSLGVVFRSSVSAKINKIVLGTPTGNAAVIVDAIESITKMLVASLNEDDYGKVVQTVPNTIKQYARTVLLIEGYITSLAPSLEPNDESNLAEVLIIVEKLKLGLKELLGAFQLFLNDVGLGIKDLNEARKASEDRVLIKPKQSSQNLESEGEKETHLSQTQDGSALERNHAGQSSNSKQRQERQPGRIEAPQRQVKNDANVFGAKDPNISFNGRKEMEMIKR